MSEPYWIALGSGGAVDYAGEWAAGTAYPAGSVVSKDGYTYIAVNPSTGQTPPAAFGSNIPVVTALPGGPVDGQEVILVDSLTAPTYQWRLRYVAGIADAYKWIFLGGIPLCVEVLTPQQLASASYVDLATVGPSLTVPRSGEYLFSMASRWLGTSVTTPGTLYHSYSLAGAAALDADAMTSGASSGNPTGDAMSREIRKTFAAGATIVSKYRSSANQYQIADRVLRLTPARIS